MAIYLGSTKMSNGGSSIKATARLAASNWSDSSQTVNVARVTTSNTLIISPSPESFYAWGDAGVYAYSQGDGTVTFKCDETPSEDLTANIVIMN